MSLSPLIVENIVRQALLEDLGHGHDITSDTLIPSDLETTAVLRAREKGILAGLVPALSAFTFTDPDFNIDIHKQDGDTLEPGDDIAIIEGSARALLTAERIALNFLSHLSGIATLTNQYVQKIENTKACVTCTRKTLPGLRALQKYAVRVGGGANHRFGLDDGILIKDNHIAVAGGIAEVLDLANHNKSHMIKIEIEVDTLNQLQEVLKHGGADIVMLDNFTLEDLKESIAIIDGRLITEASGGINLNTISDIAKTGVDFISVGALTNSASVLDIGLDIDL